MNKSNLIWCVFLLYFIQMNNYFGWNMHAESPEEMICDSVFFIIAAIALAARKT